VVGTSEFSRRSVLALGAAAAGAAIPTLVSGGEALGKGTQEKLPKLNVSHDLIAREIAGLRPFRPSGFVVRAEPFGDKVLIHNYGHGGCGVTLSWGTAEMAAKLGCRRRTAKPP
jgi:glycine/D-amino acid oxidase-like deaminating enzyme